MNLKAQSLDRKVCSLFRPEQGAQSLKAIDLQRRPADRATVKPLTKVNGGFELLTDFFQLGLLTRERGGLSEGGGRGSTSGILPGAVDLCQCQACKLLHTYWFSDARHGAGPAFQISISSRIIRLLFFLSDPASQP